MFNVRSPTLLIERWEIKWMRLVCKMNLKEVRCMWRILFHFPWKYLMVVLVIDNLVTQKSSKNSFNTTKFKWIRIHHHIDNVWSGHHLISLKSWDRMFLHLLVVWPKDYLLRTPYTYTFLVLLVRTAVQKMQNSLKGTN